MQTENFRPVSVGAQTRGNSSLLIASALVAAGIAYVLLVLQPTLVKSIGGTWGSSASLQHGNSWILPAVAAGIVIAAASLAMLLLSAFVRGVQRAPYLWLAPVLVGFSTLVLARLHVELPFYGVPLELFALLSGLLLLGGGALVQIRGVACTLSGTLMVVLPSATFIAGHIVRAQGLAAAYAHADTASGLFLFVLVLTSAGVGIVGYVTRPATGSSPLLRAREWRQHREQLAQALDRVRVTELQLAEVERRAEIAEYSLRVRDAQLGAGITGGQYRDDTADFVALARPSAKRWALPLSLVLVMVAGSMAAYVGLYRPLLHRLAMQQAFAADSAKNHAEELEALRKHFESERNAALTAERAKTAAALHDLEQARAATAAAATQPEQAPAPAAAAEAAPKTAAKVAAAAHIKSHAHATAHRRAVKTAAHARAHAQSAPAAKLPADKKAATPAATKPSESEGAKALKDESVDDDPIGGLDNL